MNVKSSLAATPAAIAELAHTMIQTGGYGRLHYGEIAETLGITRAAVHHHFPNKLDLARRVIADYCLWTEERLKEIREGNTTAKEALAAYAGLYRQIVEQGDDRMCPGGMLAAEVVVLPPDLRNEVRTFFDCHVAWIRELLLDEGIPAHEASTRALRLVSSLQGALMVSRLYGRAEHFDSVVAGLLPSILDHGGPRRRRVNSSMRPQSK